jgi:DNA mismatch endonuclease (patch repair protein)
MRLRRVRRRDTPAELRLRSELHRRGLRFRVDMAPLPGLRRRADVVFTRAKVAVFVDGCFWHGCPRHMTWPVANAEWWRAKIDQNAARDRDTDRRLSEAGWTVLRFWEHEDSGLAAAQVANLLGVAR